MMVDLSLSFSAYNEEENLPELLDKAIKVCEDIADMYEILVVVYEGSTDRSVEIVREYHHKNNNVKLVLQKKHDKGIGTAYRLGLERSQYEYLFYSDADNQFDLHEIKKLLKYVPEYDIVAGYREHRRDPFGRRMAAKMYNLLVRLVFGKTAKDLDCAFRLLKKEVVEAISLRCIGGTLTAELLIKAKRKGFKIKDVPVTHLARTKGSSVFESKIPLPKPKTVYLQVKELGKVWKDIHS